ncbi:MAG TPA: hypothetical protein IAB56_01695 [Candidatus Scybalousia intestinigallinarum]|nr:hypothetical protein [Candidatus Scybalousia intestinigallinarum]
MQENRNNTVDSQERKLSQQQEVYFKDSKIRDENVNEKVLYHGIPQDFTIFNYDYISSNSTREGDYLTDNVNLARAYPMVKMDWRYMSI